MLLGNAGVEDAAGKEFGELVEPGARGHGGGDGDDARIVLGFLDQRGGEDGGVGGGVGGRLGLGAGDDVELGDAVILVGRVLGRGIALALLGDDMDEDRALFGVADIFEDGQEVVEIVPVDGAHIVEAELLEERAAGEEGAREFLGAAGRFVEERGELRDEVAGRGAGAAIDRARDKPRQRGAQGPGRRAIDMSLSLRMTMSRASMAPALFMRLIGHARRHGAIADDGHDIALDAQMLAGDGHAEAGGNRGGGVPGAEGVVFAFGPAGEAGEPVLLAQRADAVAAAGEDLVGIGLVADVEDDAVVRGVEDRMQRHGELDHAEARAQMPAGDGDGVDHLGAQLVGKLAQVLARQGPEIGGEVDGIEQRCLRLVGHGELQGVGQSTLFRGRQQPLQQRRVSGGVPHSGRDRQARPADDLSCWRRPGGLGGEAAMVERIALVARGHDGDEAAHFRGRVEIGLVVVEDHGEMGRGQGHGLGENLGDMLEIGGDEVGLADAIVDRAERGDMVGEGNGQGSVSALLARPKVPRNMSATGSAAKSLPMAGRGAGRAARRAVGMGAGSRGRRR